jgi:hypothetical protein
MFFLPRRRTDARKGREEMLNVNAGRMQQVIQAAFDKVTGNLRWQIAIASAKQIIESNPFVHMQEDGTLLMLSDSNEIYEVTAYTCPCRAFRQGQPCKHRATRQLLIRYMAH